MVQQIAFGLNGCLTACTSGADGLTIYWVGTVASNEYARNLGLGRTVNLLQVAHLVSIEPFLEDICVGLVTNSQEETVDGDIYHLLVSLTLALHQVRTFYAILTKQSYGVVLKQYLDVLALHKTLLHHL